MSALTRTRFACDRFGQDERWEIVPAFFIARDLPAIFVRNIDSADLGSRRQRPHRLSP
jgi:hypothetical protein